MAIKPELFSSSFGFQEFFIYYSRTPDIEEDFFWKWLGFGIISGFLVYFSGRAIRYYTFSEELTEIKKKITAKKKENFNLGKGDSLHSLIDLSEKSVKESNKTQSKLDQI
jgi:hypothetical protein